MDNIALTDTYLKARKHLFESQPHRRDFIHREESNINQEIQQRLKHNEVVGGGCKHPSIPDTYVFFFLSCLLEFLFHYDGTHSSHAPVAVAVAWMKTFQLLIYQMNKKANGNPYSQCVHTYKPNDYDF